MNLKDKFGQARDVIFDPDSEAKANIDRAIMGSPLGVPLRAAYKAIQRLDTLVNAKQIGDVREFKGKPRFPAEPLMGAAEAPAEAKWREKGFYLGTRTVDVDGPEDPGGNR